MVFENGVQDSLRTLGECNDAFLEWLIRRMYLGEYVNYVAHAYLGLVVMVFIDDVLIDPSRVEGDHVGHRINSLQVLKNNK